MIKILLGMLAAVPTLFVYKVFAALGIGLVSFVGYDLLLDQVITSIQAEASGLPASLLQIMNMLGVPEAIGILFAAVQTGFILKHISRVFVGPVTPGA
jgi:cell division protein FtsX